MRKCKFGILNFVFWFKVLSHSASLCNHTNSKGEISLDAIDSKCGVIMTTCRALLALSIALCVASDQYKRIQHVSDSGKNANSLIHGIHICVLANIAYVCSSSTALVALSNCVLFIHWNTEKLHWMGYMPKWWRVKALYTVSVHIEIGTCARVCWRKANNFKTTSTICSLLDN